MVARDCETTVAAYVQPIITVEYGYYYIPTTPQHTSRPTTQPTPEPRPVPLAQTKQFHGPTAAPVLHVVAQLQRPLQGEQVSREPGAVDNIFGCVQGPLAPAVYGYYYGAPTGQTTEGIGLNLAGIGAVVLAGLETIVAAYGEPILYHIQVEHGYYYYYMPATFQPTCKPTSQPTTQPTTRTNTRTYCKRKTIS